MKATELRIRNYISFSQRGIDVYSSKEKSLNGVFVVLSLNSDGCSLENLAINNQFTSLKFNNDLLIPIPLTEEWLLKFGFEKQIEHNGHEFIKEGFSLWKGNDWEFYNYSAIDRNGDGNNEPNINLKSVHQLQNLYFALTGEELAIKS